MPSRRGGRARLGARSPPHIRRSRAACVAAAAAVLRAVFGGPAACFAAVLVAFLRVACASGMCAAFCSFLCH